MSILIKGMEMPRGRGEYELSLYVDSDGTCTVEGLYCSFEGEPFEAVTVPPHGRLIDANALIRELKEKFCMLEASDRCTEEMAMMWGSLMPFIKDVENAPTIIPAEEGE